MVLEVREVWFILFRNYYYSEKSHKITLWCPGQFSESYLKIYKMVLEVREVWIIIFINYYYSEKSHKITLWCSGQFCESLIPQLKRIFFRQIDASERSWTSSLRTECSANARVEYARIATANTFERSSRLDRTIGESNGCRYHRYLW